MSSNSTTTMARPTHSRSKPVQFNMADIAAAALANPRAAESWADQEFGEHCPDSPQSSASGSSSRFTASSSSSTAASSPSTSAPSSCPMSASPSFEGFSLSAPPRVAPAPPTAPKLRQPLAAADDVARPSHENVDRGVSPSKPRRSSSSKSLRAAEKAVALPEPTRQSDDEWSAQDFSLKLVFKSATAPASSSSTSSDEEHAVPPAFFPSQRIAFAPRLRIVRPDGLRFAAIGGMQLGVTGMCEILDPAIGAVTSKRMFADFCIDLSRGLQIWKRDAQAVRRKKGLEDEAAGEERLPPGTYNLPLNMRIPVTDRLPPSFECAQYRVYYTLALAITSATVGPNGTPRRLKVYSLPFHILPSTLPSQAPELPVLKYDVPRGVLASLAQQFVMKPLAAGYHHVMPSLPTSHFSPGGLASIPVSLRIIDRPLTPMDLYIRLALVRKTYVRESTRVSMIDAIEEEWGTPEASAREMNYPEEVLVEPWCRGEEEIVSRWGWIPYSSRPGANPAEVAQVDIRDVALPLHGLDPSNPAWNHGYSAELNLDPSLVPSQTHGECSWFSPVFRSRPPSEQEYGRHLHVSTRFFLSIEVGFASPQLATTLRELKRISPELEIPEPNTFTAPSAPRSCEQSGTSLVNPFFFPSQANSTSASCANASPLAFPGAMRELFIPITIGSVAEPTLAVLAEHAAPSCARQRAEREAREERGEDLRMELGEGSEGPWICAPPAYDEALRSAPAYVAQQA